MFKKPFDIENYKSIRHEIITQAFEAGNKKKINVNSKAQQFIKAWFLYLFNFVLFHFFFVLFNFIVIVMKSVRVRSPRYSLMRGNWIFIAFDDCHFSNKTLDTRRTEKKWNLVFDGDKEFHYCLCWMLCARQVGVFFIASVSTPRLNKLEVESEWVRRRQATLGPNKSSQKRFCISFNPCRRSDH